MSSNLLSHFCSIIYSINKNITRIRLFCCVLGHILIFNVLDRGYICLEKGLDLNYTTMTTFLYGQGFAATLVAIDPA